MRKTFYGIVLVIFLFTSKVFAADAFEFHHVFDLVNNSFYTGCNLMYLNYKEDNLEVDPTLPGNVGDKGLVYRILLNFRKVFIERVYTDLFGEFGTGNIKYDGYLLNPPHTPVQRTNFNNFIDLNLRLGGILLNQECLQVIPYGGLGYRYWDRNINGTYEYYNYKAVIGAKINFLLFGDLVLSPYANFGRTLGAHAKGDASDANNNNIGKLKFALQGKPIYEFGLEVTYKLENDFLIGGMASYTSYEYGKSDWQMAADGRKFIEPNSKTSEIRVGVGIRFGFI